MKKVAIVNNFHPMTGIGKFAFNMLKQGLKENKPIEMIYCESKDNKIPEMDGVVKIKQKLHYPVGNRTLAAYYYFPPRIPKGYGLYHVSSQYLARVALFRKPCIITHMDLAPLMLPKEYSFFLRYFFKKCLKCYGHADMILTISDQARTELLNYVNFNKLPIKQNGKWKR